MMEEDVVGDLPHLLSKLKLQLQAFSPPNPNPNQLAMSSLDSLMGNSQEGPVSFKTNRVSFQNVLTIVDFCHRVCQP